MQQGSGHIQTPVGDRLPVIPPNWKWENGIGFLPLGDKPIEYGREYFQRYLRYSFTDRGKIITRTRIELVQNWISTTCEFKREFSILDVGIGCGMFVEKMRNLGWECWGIDVNPFAIDWLNGKGWFFPAEKKADILTFWDVMEHIPHIDLIFDYHKAKFIFITMPIYFGEKEALSSKHLKPGEHCWYFTRAGLIRFMRERGYDLLELHTRESWLGGREGVESFAFGKREMIRDHESE